MHIFFRYFIVFIALSTMLASPAMAADMTLEIVPNTAAVGGQQTSTVQLQNPSGLDVQSYTIILSPNSGSIDLATLSVNDTGILKNSLMRPPSTPSTDAVFSRYEGNGTNVNPVPIGIITFTVTNPSAAPLFTVSLATVAGKRPDGAIGPYSIAPGSGVPSVPAPPFATVNSGPSSTPFPTVTRTPSIPACNLCGYCLGGPVPDDYGECVQCLYANPGSTTDPSTNQPTNPNDGVQWTVFGCMKSDAGNYTNQLVSVATAVIGGITFLVILYGGFLVLTSSGDPEKLNRGKGLVKSGIVAGIIVLFAVVILQTAGLKILQVPGF